jgi:membrane protein
MNNNDAQPAKQSLRAMVITTLYDFLDDQPFQLAAALSYYTLLSLAPLLLVVIGVAGLVFGEKAARGELVGEISSVMGHQQAQAIQAMIAHAGRSHTDIISTIIGIVILCVGATTVFGSLQLALNKIWCVKASPNTNAIWGLVRSRLLSLGVVFGLGFILLASLLLSTVISALHGYITGFFPGAATLIRIINVLVSFAVIAAVIALIFKFLPDVRIAWRAVWVGALITSALFVVGKYLISLYLGHAGIGSSYGAAGSIVVLMVWVYYTSLILFLGAEATRVYAHRRGGKGITPNAYAERVE